MIKKEEKQEQPQPICVNGIKELSNVLRVCEKEAKKIVISGYIKCYRRGRGINVFFLNDIEKGYKKYLTQNY